jgi:hypothetical protein
MARWARSSGVTALSRCRAPPRKSWLKLEPVIAHLQQAGNVSAHFDSTAHIGFSQADTGAWRPARSALYLALKFSSAF